MLSVAVLGVTIVLASGGSQTRAKAPGWQSGEHPRLIATAAEKNAMVAKLTSSGSLANRIWTDFRSTNRAGNNDIDYADGAILYWVTGDTAAGRQAIQHGLDYMTDYPSGVVPSGSSFDARWYLYRDLLLSYDFAYDLLTPSERQQFQNFIALQGARCQAANPGYSPGNINMLWAFCQYASAVLLEGENLSLTVTDEPVTRGNTPNSADALAYPIDATNIRVNDAAGQAGSVYAETTDFTYSAAAGVCTRCINWSPVGGGTREPAAGATYYVSYVFNPNIAAWKSAGRSAWEYHLNYQWHDGYYNGGHNPYGNLMAEMLPYFFAMFKRDTGVDYGRDPDVKRLVDMYVYLKLPSTLPGVTRRFNPINDSSWPDNNTVGDAWTYPQAFLNLGWRAWLRPFVAWATSAYAGDAEGYDRRYAWLWTQAFRNPDGAVKYTPNPDWREALWINDQLMAPYVDSTATPAVDWPKHRYFRGKEVVIDETNDQNQPDSSSAFVSMVAGNHNYLNEHDQGDSGSFTFFSLNDDWAIDSGYGYGDLTDHNTVGIQGLNNGQYPSTFGGFTHFDGVALADQASVMGADLRGAWSTTVGGSPVQRAKRYLASIHDGVTPAYLIVGDDIQRNSLSESYRWYFHTGRQNTVTIDQTATAATVTGYRTGGKMLIKTISPSTVTLSQAFSDDAAGNHPRLTVAADSVVNPYFLHLVAPIIGSGAVITKTTVIGGVRALVTWPDGAVDTILWRTSGQTISDDAVTSDGQLTVVRARGDVVTGVVLMDGRTVSRNGQSLVSAIDGANPVTVSAFGPTAAAATTDASRLRLGLPFVTAATLEDGGVAVPVWNDGTTAYINGGQSLSDLRRGTTVRYRQNFDDQYPGNFFRFNLSKNPAEQFGLVDGALEIRAAPYEWPSFSRRDSTPWRRSAIYPTMIPPTEHGDAVYSFRYRFANPPGADAAFRAYFRTTDRNPVDWVADQDYVRLELRATTAGAATNQVILGRRIQGPWVGPADNDILTTNLPAASASLNDTNWHTVIVRLVGDEAQVTVDGVNVVAGTLSSAPASGYLEWSVVGSSPVLLDDVAVDTIDLTAPTPPTTGTLVLHPDGTGTLTSTFGQGASTDMSRLTLYESAIPIAADTDPTTLTSIATTTTPTSLFNISGARRALYHAMAVEDNNGNRSALVPLTVDLTPPAAVTDLQSN